MATPGNFERLFINGVEGSGQAQHTQYGHIYNPLPVMPQNVGVKQYAPGIFKPTLSLQNIYRQRGMGQWTMHNLLFPSGIGGANDTEFLVLAALGNSAAPQQGDVCVMYDGTLIDYKTPNSANALQLATATFRPRSNRRMPPFPVVLDINAAIKTATNFSSTPYDDGAEASAGTTQGGVAMFQVYNPTGTPATGSLTLNGQPSDGDSFTVGIGATNYIFTFKTALTPTAGQVLIGGTVAATAANLFAAMTGGDGSGTKYAAGTVAIPQFPLSSALVFVGIPTAANVINLTAAVNGTAANAYTLAKSGVNLAVSAATMSGGVAGDTYNVTFGSSATSGGAYTTFATFSGVGAVRAAYVAVVAIGTLINEWLKITYTLASGAGTVQTFSAISAFGRWFQTA